MGSNNLAGLFQSLNTSKILVMGDFILDAYTQGKVSRISPEGPVPVLNVKSYNVLPGGAGNVVLNLVSLGAQIYSVGRVGPDSHGKLLKHALEEEGVNCEGLLFQEGFKTPFKNRVIADSQQIVRIDDEEMTRISPVIEEEILAILPKLIDEVQVIAISDYGKGFLTDTILSTTFRLAREKDIPVLVDPKRLDFAAYKGATLVKPNLLEAQKAANSDSDKDLDYIGFSLLKQIEAKYLLITRSNKGMSLFTKEGREDFPVKSKEVIDVTGAGDTVLSTLAIAFASGLGIQKAIELANIAAGLVVEHLGCARISLGELAERLLELNAQNKIFEEDHLFALQKVLKNSKCSLLVIEEVESLTSSLFQAVKKLSLQDENSRLIVYLKDKHPDSGFLELLSSLPGIDFIILKKENLKNLLDKINPHRLYHIQKDAFTTLKNKENILI